MFNKLSLITSDGAIIFVNTVGEISNLLAKVSKDMLSLKSTIIAKRIGDEIYRITDVMVCILSNWLIPDTLFLRLKTQPEEFEIVAARYVTSVGCAVFPFKVII